MTARDAPAPARRWVGAGCLLLIALALSSCVYSGAMVAAALVGGTGASGSETAKAPGTGIQNGRYVDPSIGQALAASEGLPLDICRSRLPESEPLPPGQCALRPVCLPGASQPTELHVCSAPR